MERIRRSRHGWGGAGGRLLVGQQFTCTHLLLHYTTACLSASKQRRLMCRLVLLAHARACGVPHQHLSRLCIDTAKICVASYVYSSQTFILVRQPLQSLGPYTQITVCLSEHSHKSMCLSMYIHNSTYMSINRRICTTFAHTKEYTSLYTCESRF